MELKFDTLIRRAKRLQMQAQHLDVKEYVRLQRNSVGEDISLVCAAPTTLRDQVLLVFKTVLKGKTEFFTGIVYLSKKAADAAGLSGAWYREIYGNAKSYWVNAEWGSWSLDEVVQTAREYGLEEDVICKLGLQQV